jgi:hypothetical protein
LQYFIKDFSKLCLSPYSSKIGIWVEVFNMGHGDFALGDVLMKMSKGKDKRIMLTRFWYRIVQKMEMKAGQIYLFWFRRTTSVLGRGVRIYVERVV